MILQRGRAPIEKNTRVIGGDGTEYEPTYPKRAKGLVKKGRARFEGQNTIRLIDSALNINIPDVPARPADIDSLNLNISENIKMDNQNTNEYTGTDTVNAPKASAGIASPNALDINYIMSRIDMIINQNHYIEEALSSISNMQVNESPMGGEGDKGRAEAIQGAVQARETTNQKILSILEKMYDDLKPQKPDLKKDMFDSIIGAIQGAGPFSEEQAVLADHINSIIDSLRHINN